MKPDTNNALIAIAAAATALAAAATALVSGSENTACVTATTSTSDHVPSADETPAPTTRRRGRPPATPAAEPNPAAVEAEVVEPAKESGMTLDTLQSLIRPLVEAGQGAEVKKVIQKYAPKLSEIEPKDHTTFARDIDAMSM